MKEDKRGMIIGSFIVDLPTFIIVTFLLVSFLFFSGAVKSFDKSEGGIKVSVGDEIGLYDLNSYMGESFEKIIGSRINFAKGNPVDSGNEGGVK